MNPIKKILRILGLKKEKHIYIDCPKHGRHYYTHRLDGINYCWPCLEEKRREKQNTNQ